VHPQNSALPIVFITPVARMIQGSTEKVYGQYPFVPYFLFFFFLDRPADFMKSLRSAAGRRFEPIRKDQRLPDCIPGKSAFRKRGFSGAGIFMVIYAKLFLTAIFWGGTFVAARVVAQDVDPFSASFLRFFAASLFLTALVLRKEGRFPRLRRHQVIPVVLLGLTGVFAYNVFFFLGLKTITAGRASLIVATNPVFISLLSTLLFREKLNSGKIMGIILCLCGAVLVISRGNPLTLFTGGVGWGELHITGCVASWVAYTLIGKVIMKDFTPLAAVTCSCLIGTAALLPPALLENITELAGGFSLTDWTGILFLAFFGTVLGFLWYYEGIQAIGPSRASVFINFVPVSGVFLGWLILDEAVNLSLLAGASLVVGGVYWTNRTR
jgi:drug/metabolite transporter (DMT)-like permease